MLLLNNTTHVVSFSHAATEQYNSRYVLHTCCYLTIQLTLCPSLTLLLNNTTHVMSCTHAATYSHRHYNSWRLRMYEGRSEINASYLFPWKLH